MSHSGNSTLKTAGRWRLDRRAVWTVFLAVAFSLPNAPWAGEDLSGSKPPVVLVVVNGDSITSSDLDRLLIETHQSMGMLERQDFDYHKLLNRLVNDRLLVQEAVALGIDQDPKLLELLDRKRDKQAVSRWVKDHYKPDIQVGEAAVHDYYAENFARRQLRVVTVQTEPEAKTVYAALRMGADMDSLAREQSIDAYKATGGLRKLTHYYELEPALRSRTDGMAVGDLSEPFSYRSVFALARVEQDVPADTAAFEAMRPKIESWLKQEEGNRQWNAFIAGVRNQVEVVADSVTLKAIAADSANLFTPGFSVGTDQIVFRTGQGVQISDAELRKEIAHAAMSASGSPYTELFQNTVSKVSEMLVLISAASRDGCRELPEVTEGYNQSLDSALVEIYVKETVLPRMTFRRAEFESYYQDHQEEFKLPDECQFDRMTIDSVQVAKDVSSRLREGADFRYVSRQVGARIAPLEESTEWIEVTSFPDTLQREIAALRIGECTSPHQIDDGWLILKLKARRPGQVPPLDQVESKIREAMFQQKFDVQLDSVLTMLKEHSDIQYNDEAIREYFGDDS